MLEIKNLTKDFGPKKVLKGINLKVEKGERLVIIGPSGCGKTTLLRCINGLEIPTTGQITFNKEDLWINSKVNNNIRQKMGMIFQAYNLFPHLKVRDNLTLALTKLKIKTNAQADKAAETMLKKVGLLDKIDEYPNKLSGGQKQRVAIARTLVMKPEILLVDEPTSSLDPNMINEVTNLMKTIADEGMTMIIISHEMSFVRKIATRIIFIDDGKIIEEGPPEVIFKQPKHDKLKVFLQKLEE